MEKLTKVESLQEIIAEMTDSSTRNPNIHTEKINP